MLACLGRGQHSFGIRPRRWCADVEHPEVRAISFTGSSAVGRTIGTVAAKSFKHCSLELGGKNPMIVLNDANIDLALEGALWGAFGTTGQRCTATSRILVQKGVYTSSSTAWSNAPASYGGQRTRRNHRDGARRQRAPAENRSRVHRDRPNEGAKMLCGGHRLEKATSSMDGSLSRRSSAMSIPRCGSRRKKSSAPWSRSSRARLEDAIQIANNIDYGLSSAHLHADVNKAFTAMRDLTPASLHQCPDNRC